MRLLRPYIPLHVRLLVIERQARAGWNYSIMDQKLFEGYFPALKDRIRMLLQVTFRADSVHLDHDPALENRIKVFDDNGKLIGYQPDANDPEYLIYRTKPGHYIKTHVRGDGAQYSDTALAKRERKRNRTKKKYKWPSRPFPKRVKLDPSVRLTKLRELERKR
jgi:hypothetical protein